MTVCAGTTLPVAAGPDHGFRSTTLVVEMLSREHGRRLAQRNVVQAETSLAAQMEGRPPYPRNTVFLNRGDGKGEVIGR
jgi:hypothetical protein